MGKSGWIRVFVYGTLLPGEPNHWVAAPYVQACEPGAVRGRMYDAGPYPGLVLDADGPRVRGVWLVMSAEGLRALDALEEFLGPEEVNDYERVWVRDACSGRTGWIYVWPDGRGLPEVTGDYWPDYRRKKGCAHGK